MTHEVDTTKLADAALQSEGIEAYFPDVPSDMYDQRNYVVILACWLDSHAQSWSAGDEHFDVDNLNGLAEMVSQYDNCEGVFS